MSSEVSGTWPNGRTGAIWSGSAANAPTPCSDVRRYSTFEVQLYGRIVDGRADVGDNPQGPMAWTTA
jgi:hypothetical protein